MPCVSASTFAILGWLLLSTGVVQGQAGHVQNQQNSSRDNLKLVDNYTGILHMHSNSHDGTSPPQQQILLKLQVFIVPATLGCIVCSIEASP